MPKDFQIIKNKKKFNYFDPNKNFINCIKKKLL